MSFGGVGLAMILVGFLTGCLFDTKDHPRLASLLVRMIMIGLIMLTTSMIVATVRWATEHLP